MTPSLPLLLALAATALAPVLCRLGGRRGGRWVALGPFAAFVALAAAVGPTTSGEIPLASLPVLPDLGIALSFHLDPLALLFGLLVTGIGAAVFVYAADYLGDHPRASHFLTLLAAFHAAMLALVLAADLITIYVAFELTSVASFLLIGFERHRPEARAASRQALLVTALGGLALLAGLLLLGGVAGSFALADVLAAAPAITAAPEASAIVLLVALAAFTKSAQFPFHFWLPDAMAAPTPVSAYLHSATLVKAGVFLLARLAPALSDVPAWPPLLTVGGAVTMGVGAWMTLAERDLKGLLAWSTVMALGLLVVLLGLGTPEATLAALLYLVVHALYKAALFMGVGAIDHATGTRDLAHLGGLGRALPWLAVGLAVSAASMAGLPPLLGFIGKELAYAALADTSAGAALLVLVVLANATLVAAAALVTLRPLRGRELPTSVAHPPTWGLLVPPAVLGLAALALGLLPGPLGAALIGPAGAAVHGEPVASSLSLWHGLTTELALTAVTLLVGLALYRAWPRILGGAPTAWFRRWFALGPAITWQRADAGLLTLARALVRLVQPGLLRRYLLVTLGALALALTLALLRLPALPVPAADGLHLTDAALTLLMLAAAAAACAMRPTLRALLVLGASGFVNAVIFLVFGAPELAMTQFLVETLLLIVLVLTFTRLPDPDLRDRAPRRALSLAIAVSLGASVTVLGFAAGAPVHPPGDVAAFARETAAAGHGLNVVNAILSDFRALDTLGEIVVLATAGLGIRALVQLGASREAA